METPFHTLKKHNKALLKDGFIALHVALLCLPLTVLLFSHRHPVLLPVSE